MATRYAVANGNWSALATWDGGASLPGASDDVYADGKTVTIDQDITVLSLRNTQRTGGTVGGTFAVSSITGTRTLNVGMIVTAPSSTHCVTHTSTTGTLVANGTFYGASNANFGGIYCAAGTTLVATGVTSGGANSGAGIMGVSANITFTGPVLGAGASAYGGHGMYVTNCVVTVTGDVRGGTGANGNGIWAGGSTVTVTGIVYSGPGDPSYSLYAPAINLSGASVLTHTGPIYAANGCPAITSPVGTTVTLTGPFIGAPNGMPAISCGQFRLNPVANDYYEFRDTTQQPKRLYSADWVGDTPSAMNVRFGTVYNNGQTTGTCAIPPREAVSYGVPVDNTTGTAAVQAQDIWNVLTNTNFPVGSMGERLKNTATVQQVADITAALEGT